MSPVFHLAVHPTLICSGTQTSNMADKMIVQVHDGKNIRVHVAHTHPKQCATAPRREPAVAVFFQLGPLMATVRAPVTLRRDVAGAVRRI